MTVTDTAPPLALAAGEGDAYWWTGELATVKAASEDTNGHLALVEILAPEGVQIPLHVHHREHEGFWVLEGQLTFTVGGHTLRARAGDFLLGPRGVPHTYTVDAGPARLLFLFAPAGLEELIRRTGVPATERTLPPEHIEQDMGLLAALAPEFGIELVG